MATTTIGAATDELRAAIRMAPADWVRRGAILLDEKRPGWHREVGREIRMASNEDCVLGQLWKHFIYGLDSLGLTSAWPYGFGSPSFEGAEACFAELANLWRAEIEARLEGEGVVLAG